MKNQNSINFIMFTNKQQTTPLSLFRQRNNSKVVVLEWKICNINDVSLLAWMNNSLKSHILMLMIYAHE